MICFGKAVKLEKVFFLAWLEKLQGLAAVHSFLLHLLNLHIDHTNDCIRFICAL
jgi:hypothetical protein